MLDNKPKIKQHSVSHDGPQYLKNKGLLPASSSQERGWDGFVVEQRCDPLCDIYDVNFPPFSAHFIAMHLGAPTIMEQERDGQIHKRSNTYGDINIMPAGLPNRWSSTAIGETEFSNDIFLWLYPAFLRKVAQENELNFDRIEIINVFETRDPRIEHIALALKAELENESLGGRVFAESLVTAIAVHLIRSYNAFPQSLCQKCGGLSQQVLRQAVEFIQDNFDQDISLGQIAASVHISPYHFARLFKQSTGLPPHQYLIQCRIERAKNLMLKDKLSLSQIAAVVGFADRSHLVRHFKRITGQTPQAFLQNYKNSKNVHYSSNNLHSEDYQIV